jgi:hypothetical protein
MIGRIYDPEARRFLTPDPFIQDPLSSQSHNRYSYVWNNPSTFTDPTGFYKEEGGSDDDPATASQPGEVIEIKGKSAIQLAWEAFMVELALDREYIHLLDARIALGRALAKRIWVQRAAMSMRSAGGFVPSYGPLFTPDMMAGAHTDCGYEGCGLALATLDSVVQWALAAAESESIITAYQDSLSEMTNYREGGTGYAAGMAAQSAILGREAEHAEAVRRGPLMPFRPSPGIAAGGRGAVPPAQRVAPPSQSIKKQVRERSRDAHGGKLVCDKCGRDDLIDPPMNRGGQPKPPNAAEVDHIKRRADGGDNSLHNLRVLCPSCNNQ